MNQKDLKKLVAFGLEISNTAANGSGFVRVGDLIAALNTQIEFRPLLVEGMVAQPKAGANASWKILIDSETHGDLSERLPTESVSSPLENRIRNTIAHELVHVLAFRVAETGLDERLSREALVEAIEDETERLSALLLIAQSALESELARAGDDGLTISTLVEATKRWAVSPPILVRRFELLPFISDYSLRYHPALKNFAVGVAEWMGKDFAEPCSQWLYSNFSDMSPEFVLKLRNRENVSTAEIFTSPDFVLNGGSSVSTEEVVYGGTVANPKSEKMKVRFSVQGVNRVRGARFLWTMQRVKE